MKTVRILLAEDEQLTALSLEKRLAQLGHEVVAIVNSGEEAIAKTQELRPGLVIMDIKLAGVMDGVEAAGRIREKTDVPVVYLTAYADDHTLERAKITEPQGYILKPFDAHDLRTTIEIAMHRKAMDRQLRSSESRYRIVSELSSDFAYCFLVLPDRTLACEWVTDAFRRITGHSPDAFEARGGWHDIVHPDDRDMYAHRLVNLLNGMPDVREYRILTPAGAERWIRDSARAEWNPAEGRVDRIIGAAQDITCQKEVEDALRREQALYAALFENIPVQTVVVDLEGRIIAYNKAKEDSGDRLPPLGAVMYRDYAARHQADMYGEMMQAIGDGHRRDFPDMTYRDRVLNIAITPFERGAIITTQDVTDVRRAEEQRRRYETKSRQSQKLESLGVMAGGIAHDFNNLLMAVLGNAELAHMDLPKESPIRANIAAIEKAGRKAAELANQMLAYSGKGRIRLKVVSANQIVRETAAAIKPNLPGNIALLLDIDPDLPDVAADPVQMQQVLTNLITNSMEAIGENNGTIALRTRIHRRADTHTQRHDTVTDLSPGNYIAIEVHDTGCGIEPGLSERIFDPFFTTKFTGRGLGLAAALGIVRGHRGSLRVESKLGAGTSMHVLLPTARSEIETPLDISTPPDNADTILIADDEAAVRDVASDMLARAGYRIVLARDGAEAIETFRMHRDRIACVLLDLTMPHLNGEEVFRKIHEMAPKLPVVLSSGYEADEATDRLSGKGLAGFIQKPYSSENLLDTVNQALRSSG